MAASFPSAKSTDLANAFNFRFSIVWSSGDAEVDIPFDKLSGIRETTGQIEWRPSGDSSTNIKKLAGLTRADNVTLEKCYASNSEDLAKIRKLARAAQQKEGLVTPYFTGVIYTHGNMTWDEGSAEKIQGRAIYLENCVMVGTSLNDFDVNSTELSQFSIEIAYQRIRFQGEKN